MRRTTLSARARRGNGRSRFLRIPAAWMLPLALLFAPGGTSRADDAPDSSVTFSRDIAPLFQRSCQGCHRPGEAAPMSLLDYQSARPWAKSIKKTVTGRTMPPWFANPDHGTFANDPRLSEAEIALVGRWADQGAPEGDPRDLPPPLQFEEGWAIGRPDLVLTVDKPFELPAEGIIPYQEFTVEFPVTGWVSKIEIRPSNRKVAHHINMYREEPLGPNRYGFRKFTTGYIPGGGPTGYPSDIALRMIQGSRLRLQAHYVTTGRPETDQTSIGFVFAREPVRREMRLMMIGDYSFEIPPGAPAHEVRASWKPTEPIVVFGTYAHMHLRGKDFRFTAKPPSGGETILMDIPKYDFEWQLGYIFKDRPEVAAGTEIEILAHLDNSAANPHNPDPAATVKYGEQTTDEMVIGAVFWYKPEEDLREGAGAKDLWSPGLASAR